MAVRSLKNSTIENFANYSSSMNAGYSFQDYELIESVFLASSSPSITFSNLAQYATEYKHLQLRGSLRTGRSGFNEDVLGIRFNGIISNYRWHQMEGNGSSVSSYAEVTTGIRISQQPAASATANAFGAFVVDIIDAYSNTKNKTFRSLSGMSSGSNFVTLFSGFHETTNPITELVVYSQTGNTINQSSRLSLYGIR